MYEKCMYVKCMYVKCIYVKCTYACNMYENVCTVQQDLSPKSFVSNASVILLLLGESPKLTG
jgi:hypothetical protein